MCVIFSLCSVSVSVLRVSLSFVNLLSCILCLIVCLALLWTLYLVFCVCVSYGRDLSCALYWSVYACLCSLSLNFFFFSVCLSVCAVGSQHVCSVA